MPWEYKNVYFVDPAETNEKLIELICEGEYVLLHGPRTSGKIHSTRTLRAMDQLEEKGYICIYYSFSYLSENVDGFWTTVARGTRRELAEKYRIKLGETKSYKNLIIYPERFRA
ncbi:14592_t:CDS:2 [Funneliformis caledonium]|uniref:14592_t:CDS:1 n=1 Tax=Funneliformis caledonium TaxID=1117310 RepID=A0A9N9ESM2_9GLOM|nr:14592_t:CDS:2 [Funneliformis caledonium]